MTLLASRRVYEFDTGILIDILTNGGQELWTVKQSFDNSATGASLTFEFDDVDINDGVAVPQILVDYQLRIDDLLRSETSQCVNANGALMGLCLKIDESSSDLLPDTVTAPSATFGIDANSVPGVGSDIEIQASGADIADGETDLDVPGANRHGYYV